MTKENLNETFHKLCHDYLDLCDSYSDQLPIHEFGFGMIRLVSKMLFDCAPSESIARETIEVGIEEGFLWSQEDKGLR